MTTARTMLLMTIPPHSPTSRKPYPRLREIITSPATTVTAPAMLMTRAVASAMARTASFRSRARYGTIASSITAKPPSQSAAPTT